MTNMAKESAKPDHLVARIARRQHGIVTFDQLLAAGLAPSSIALRSRTARLHRLHRGVYAVGQPKLTPEGIWLAAVKACGPGVALSHLSAAQHSRMLPLTANPRPVHVTVPGDGGRRRRDGIAVHRSTTITAADVHLRDRIPTTKPARTLAALKPLLPEGNGRRPSIEPASSHCQSATWRSRIPPGAASSGRCAASAAATACRRPS